MAEQGGIKTEARPEVEDLLSPGFAKPTNTTERPCVCSKKMIIVVVVMLTVLVLYGMGLGLGITLGLDSDEGGDVEKVIMGAVVTDHEACSGVGRDILQKGGSAVDAAIGALLCNGVRQPHSMGLGGGCLMVIYSKYPDSIDVIDGREIAPIASRSVFNKSFQEEYASNESIVYTKAAGPKMIAVPGELKAYWLAHKKHGLLPWKDLFKPAIEMAENGHPLSHSTALALQRKRKSSLLDFPLRELFTNSEGKILKEGDIVKMPKLAQTLHGIAEFGPDYMYNGTVAREIINEIQAAGGILTEEDFRSYNARTEQPLSFRIGNLTMYTSGAVSGGPILGLILKILSGFNLTANDISSRQGEAETYHKIIEAFKFAYAHRTRMADPSFIDLDNLMNNITSDNYAEFLRQLIDINHTHNTSYYMGGLSSVEDHGTSHISVLGPSGDAVSVSSSINYYFGSRVLSNSTGILWNNEMADFDMLEPDSPNSVEPGKRPLSSMAPAIFVDNDEKVKLILGAAGGTRIITTIAQLAARVLYLGEKLDESIKKLRFHHQLFPNKLIFEKDFPKDILLLLEAKGHVIEEQKYYMGVAQGIYRDPSTGVIQGASDYRKRPGKASFLSWNVVKNTK